MAFAVFHGSNNGSRRTGAPRAALALAGGKRARNLLCKKSEARFCETIAAIFHRARSEAHSLGHHLQTAAKFSVALLHMVPYFATLVLCNQRVGNPTPRYRLPILQLTYFSA
jgi:hypothetical protein